MTAPAPNPESTRTLNRPGTDNPPATWRNPLELWGGVECTVNRVKNCWHDQIQYSGHFSRLDDLDRLAELGLKTLRFPILWEHVWPDPNRRPYWALLDGRIDRMSSLGIRPVAGLVHHGSGPRHTSLLDDSFIAGLAGYARSVAQRYPQIEHYTPVNEPMTTARFSGLYGHWYPHHRSTASFLRALVVQCKAVAEAMRAVREVNPHAKLVQTEDLAMTYSTSRLSLQAEYENHRRWLTWDLLCGKLTPEHVMWNHFIEFDTKPYDLEWFVTNPCPPDIMGVNFYLTSERFLDHRLERYPEWTHGGNGTCRYADVESVRVRAEGLTGLAAMLREVWLRYRIPIVVTEIHLGCTREEQMRWLWEVWQEAHKARSKGVDIRALTAWAMFGLFDWQNLVTCETGSYEPGAFDVRSSPPRPTALAKLISELARGQKPIHPVLNTPGWWRREERLCYPAVRTEVRCLETSTFVPATDPSPISILIVGAGGCVGSELQHVCQIRGLAHLACDRSQLDIMDAKAVEAIVDLHSPWAVINAAGFTHVDHAEHDRQQCWRVNWYGPQVLARICHHRRISFVTFSSDLVFDGKNPRPYVEEDHARPLNQYGKSKLATEREVLSIDSRALIVRPGMIFSAKNDHHFVPRVLGTIRQGESINAASDWQLSPTYLPDLAHAVIDLLIDGEQGIWHLNNAGAVAWDAWAMFIAETAGYQCNFVKPCRWSQFALPAKRPPNSSLASVRGQLLPTWQNAVARCLQDVPSSCV